MTEANEMGKLPEGWRRVRLGDLGTFKTSSVDKKVNKDEKWVKLINYMDVYKHNFVDKSLELMDVTANDHEIAVSRVKKGDILFTPSSETPDDIGHSGVVLGCPPNTLYSYHLMRQDIKGEIELDLKFRGYFCNYGGVLKEFARISTGVTRFTLCKSDFENTKVIIPSSLPEQHKIAEILETVDNAIERTDIIIEKYKRIKQGLMQDLLTRGVVGNDELGVMNYELRDEKKHGFKDSTLGRIPEEWEVVELMNGIGGNANLIVAGPFGSNLKVEDYKKTGIPIIRLQNIDENKFIDKDIKFIADKKAKELSYHSFISGDLILAKLGDPIGKTCIVPNNFEYGIVVADVVRIRVNEQYADKRFISYILNFDICRNQLNTDIIGTTRPRVNLDQIRTAKIPLPPLSEQHRIASILSQTDETIEKEQKYKQKLESIKQGLMVDLLTGKARVNHLIKEGMKNVQTA